MTIIQNYTIEENTENLKRFFSPNMISGSNGKSNSFIFSGPKGVGKRSTANLIAEKILGNTTSHNLFFIEDNHKNIPVDKVREINGFVSKKSYSDAPKVVIIDSIDNLNTHAANALLKPLEEHVGYSYFILISHHLNKTLKTIRSRCINIQFTAPEYHISQDIVSKKFPDVDFKYISRSLSLCNNIPGATIELINNSGLQFYDELLSVAWCFADNAELFFEFVDNKFSKKDSIQNWCSLKLFLPQLVVSIIKHKNQINNPSLSLIPQEQKLVKYLAAKKDLKDWLSLYDYINKLLHYTDFSNLSIPNTVIVALYKVLR